MTFESEYLLLSGRDSKSMTASGAMCEALRCDRIESTEEMKNNCAELLEWAVNLIKLTTPSSCGRNDLSDVLKLTG